MKTVTTIIMIGKSKKEIAYTFNVDDFIRIEQDILILKSDDRKLKIADDFINETILKLND